MSKDDKKGGRGPTVAETGSAPDRQVAAHVRVIGPGAKRLREIDKILFAGGLPSSKGERILDERRRLISAVEDWQPTAPPRNPTPLHQ